MALNGCSLGAFFVKYRLFMSMIVSNVVLFVFLVLLYCKAISMEWMNMNVKFI